MKEIILNFLNTLPYGNYLSNKYFFSVLILIVFVFIGRLLLFVFTRYLKKFAGKTKTEVDDMIVEHTKKPIFYLILAYGLKISLLNLGFVGIMTKIIDSFMAPVFLLIILKIIDILVEVWGLAIAKKTKNQLDEVLLPLFHKTLKVVFVVVSFLWILNIWNINITPYLAGVGISGLILGLALQDSLKNVFGGLTLVFDKNFNLGDPIRLESGELGTIKEIGLRSTKMLTYDHEVIFIPNGQLANMRIHNYVKPNTQIRKIIDFSVEYGSDIEKVKKVVLKAMKGIKDIHNDPEIDVIFVQMADSGLIFKARFWVDWNNAYSKWIEATQKIYEALRKEKIGIPFPTRTIYIKK